MTFVKARQVWKIIPPNCNEAVVYCHPFLLSMGSCSDQPKAQKVRTIIRQEFDQAFSKFDALITPTSPTVPFKIGEKVADPLQMYLSDVCTLPINIAGVPAISIPAGFANGLPIGMQIIGKPFSEETLLRIAYAYEQATDWHKRKPNI